MTRAKFLGLTVSTGLLVAISLSCPARSYGQGGFSPQPRQSNNLKEPVYRIGRAKVDPNERQDVHPLDAAMDMAKSALATFRNDVRDYSTTVVKREQINGKLLDYEYMFMKVRTRRFQESRLVEPLHVYMYFLKPDTIKGREVIWVENRNENKMVAHEGGMKGKLLPTVWLPIDGQLAMYNQRYPISEIGIENLIYRLIERGQYERQFEETIVRFQKGASINKRACTLLEIEHPVQRPHFEFHKARIYIDDELNLPIRYAAFFWPDQPNGPLKVIEEYTYLNLKLNQGFTEADFDHRNPKYGF